MFYFATKTRKIVKIIYPFTWLRKMHMKRFLLLMVSLVLALVAGAEAYPYLSFRYADGSASSFGVESLSMTFADSDRQLRGDAEGRRHRAGHIHRSGQLHNVGPRRWLAFGRTGSRWRPGRTGWKRQFCPHHLPRHVVWQQLYADERHIVVNGYRFTDRPHWPTISTAQ